VSFDANQAVWLAGPTAVGKSAVALALAERLGGEIISVDSMQVYRGLDLGTAKPSPADRARVRHHLIDVVEPDAAFDAAQFVRLAKGAADEVAGRGRVPVFCGGTGLYFKALRSGLGAAPAGDPALRAELEAAPLAALLEELAARDPVAFARIDRQNPRRVVRAIEVIRLTGQPFSVQRADWSAPPVAGAPPRARIATRVDAMFAGGLVAETERLLARGLAQNRTAMQALGYRQVVEHLRGERGRAETIALVQQRTWQFARRQMTWFRRQLAVTWIELTPESAPEAVAGQILARRKTVPEVAPRGAGD
jgi:tRNA dimethylallyltransferase